MAKQGRSRYSIGVDFGTNSVRALIVNIDNGEEVATKVFNYPSGEQGILLDRKDPNLARQNPEDYVRGFIAATSGAVRAARKKRGFDPKRIN